MVSLKWYCLTRSLDHDFARSYLALCRRSLPEALPRRFGEFEPFQHKYSESGEGFVAAWHAATSTVSFSAAAPCISGAMHAGPSDTHPGLIWSLGLEVLRDPLQDRQWRGTARRLFIDVAERLGAFFASAEVTRWHIWSGGAVWTDAQTEWPIWPYAAQGWMGLPPTRCGGAGTGACTAT